MPEEIIEEFGKDLKVVKTENGYSLERGTEILAFIPHDEDHAEIKAVHYAMGYYSASRNPLMELMEQEVESDDEVEE